MLYPVKKVTEYSVNSVVTEYRTFTEIENNNLVIKLIVDLVGVSQYHRTGGGWTDFY